MSEILPATPRIFSMLPTRTKPAAAVLLGAVGQGIKSPLHQGIPFRLSNARFRQGLAASHVSYAAGLSESVVRSVEDSVQLPKIDTIERIACALGVAPCWLAFGQEGDLQWAGRRPRPALRDEPPDAIPGGIVYQARRALATWPRLACRLPRRCAQLVLCGPLRKWKACRAKRLLSLHRIMFLKPARARCKPSASACKTICAPPPVGIVKTRWRCSSYFAQRQLDCSVCAARTNYTALRPHVTGSWFASDALPLA